MARSTGGPGGRHTERMPVVPARPPRSGAWTALLVLAGGLYVAGGLYAGWIFLATLNNVMAGRDEPPIQIPPPSIIVQSNPRPTPAPGARPTALAAAATPTPRTPATATARAVAAATVASGAPTPAPTEPLTPLPEWEGSERVTVLLLGIDQREDERDRQDPSRSDTMILATFDPASGSAGMLSIPRDLFVPIPGHGEGKINTAHFYGELEQPGSGPQLAKRTVQYNLGVHVHHYARVDFHGFERLIDAVGGVTVDVERPIKDDLYPNETYGTIRVYFPAGLQRLDGRSALRYARSRHSESDFGRSRRQQRVILAARDAALRLQMLPRLPQLIGILSSSVSTDLSPDKLLSLAVSARNLKTEDIVTRSIDENYVVDAYGDGSVLLPNRPRIQTLVAEVFGDLGVRREAARIEVLNGTTRNGLARSTADALTAAGFAVIRVDQAPRTDYAQTVIIDRAGKKATVDRLIKELRVAPGNVRTEAPGTGVPDVTIILGGDARNPG